MKEKIARVLANHLVAGNIEMNYVNIEQLTDEIVAAICIQPDRLISKQINAMVKNLAYQVSEIRRVKQEMDRASWAMCRGVIITGEDAELISKVLDSIAELPGKTAPSPASGAEPPGETTPSVAGATSPPEGGEKPPARG